MPASGIFVDASEAPSRDDLLGEPKNDIELNQFRKVMNMVIGKWKIDIIWVLLAGPLRFGQLRRRPPGVTQHMLTAQLRALEADRLVTRTAYAETPPRVEYALTENAYALKPIFLDLLKWSREVHKKAPL